MGCCIDDWGFFGLGRVVVCMPVCVCERPLALKSAISRFTLLAGHCCMFCLFTFVQRQYSGLVFILCVSCGSGNLRW